MVKIVPTKRKDIARKSLQHETSETHDVHIGGRIFKIQRFSGRGKL